MPREQAPIGRGRVSVATARGVVTSPDGGAATMATMRGVIVDAYTAFNARDIDRALEVMHPAVEWDNGMEGGYVHGHQSVRDYWTRQWTQIDPHVEPQRVTVG